MSRRITKRFGEIEFDDDDVVEIVESISTETSNIDDDVVEDPKNDFMDLSTMSSCPRCGKQLTPALALSGAESSCFLECKECGTLVNTFTPLTHQLEFLTHPARYKMSAGGYGSGKSAVDIQYAIKHLLLIPMSRVCVCGRSYPALETTFQEEFTNIFPKKLLRRKNEQKREWTFTNGSVLVLRSFDDPTKLKSMNLTLVIIVEASDVPESGFTMMQSRIRNSAALMPEYDLQGNVVTYYDEKSKSTKIKYAYDARHILMETNPASNWVKKFLTESADVRYYGSAQNEGYVMSPTPDPKRFTQVISTDANPYLPETYEEELSRGKSPAWIKQFLKGSFNFNNNLVYPNVGLCIVQPHELPREYNEYGHRTLFFAVGLDYGIVDPTHIVYAAYSTETKKLYVYDEMRINNADVRTIAREYRKNTRINGTNLEGLLMLPRFDGRSYNKRESDLHTIGGAFESCGLFFEPSFAQREIRVIKLNSLINHNQIEIYANCEFLLEEMLNLPFVLDKDGNPTKVPKDGKDHGVTALEFIVVELPHNLCELNLSAYLPAGTRHIHDKLYEAPKPTRKEKQYDPLSYTNEEEETYYDISTDMHFGISNIRLYDAIDTDVDVLEDEEENTNYINSKRLSSYTPGDF